MTRIDFYFNVVNKADVVRKLAAKALHAKKHSLIFTRDKTRARELDAYLWLSPPLSFLPHVLCGHPLAAKTPVLIGDDPGKLTQPDVLINVTAEIPDCFARFDRLLEIVTEDPLDQDAARNRFRYFRERGYPLEVHDLKAS